MAKAHSSAPRNKYEAQTVRENQQTVVHLVCHECTTEQGFDTLETVVTDIPELGEGAEKAAEVLEDDHRARTGHTNIKRLPVEVPRSYLEAIGRGVTRE